MKILDGIHALFNHAGFRAFWVRMRVPLVLAIAVAVLWFAGPRWLWPGFFVSMAGELIQLWCFASLDKNRDLACNGPYALTRNPMYLGRFLIVLGVVLLLGSGWMIVVYTVIYYFYMVNRVKREEAHLRAVLGAPYAEYCAAVRRFLPGRPYQGNPVLYWNWALLRQNHGWANLGGTLAFWIAAAVRVWWL
jgi:protein-S-isoprenylcysteine O-methyltransferase Ste14